MVKNTKEGWCVMENESREYVVECLECGAETVIENSFGEWFCQNCDYDMTEELS